MLALKTCVSKTATTTANADTTTTTITTTAAKVGKKKNNNNSNSKNRAGNVKNQKRDTVFFLFLLKANVCGCAVADRN